jgi:hypothetical protein
MKDESGHTIRMDERTTQLLGDIKQWIKSPTLVGALRCCIERMHSDMEHVRKPEERPLAVFGQGDYTREIREEDC